MGRKKKNKLEDELFTLEEEDKIKSEQKATSTAFILMYPSAILVGIVIWYASLISGMLALSLGVYQFLMLKKFIEDYYKGR